MAVIATVAALTWGNVVIQKAEREARIMAKECARDYITKWLAEEAPGIVREQVDMITNASLGPGNDAMAADAIGKEAG